MKIGHEDRVTVNKSTTHDKDKGKLAGTLSLFTLYVFPLVLLSDTSVCKCRDKRQFIQYIGSLYHSHYKDYQWAASRVPPCVMLHQSAMSRGDTNLFPKNAVKS